MTHLSFGSALTIAALLTGLSGPAQARNRLEGSKAAPVSLEGVEALVKLGPQEALAPLLALVMDDSAPLVVTRRSIEALGDFGRPEAVPQLVEMLVHEHQARSFSLESAFALFQTGTPAADALLAVLKKTASPALAHARSRGVEPLLLGLSAEVLGDLEDPRAEALLIPLLSFEHRDEDLTLFVRRSAAYALGRLRSSSAVRPLSAMLKEESPATRDQYARALGQIGDRKALGALAEAATVGEWDVRGVTIAGFTMLGDERELRIFEDLVRGEEDRIRTTCREHPNYDGCEKAEETAKKHAELVRVFGKRLEAARQCEQAATCWVQKLDDPEPRIRERAALELGKRGDGSHTDALFARLDDKDQRVQLVSVESLHWLLKASGDARERARKHLFGLDKRLLEGRGNVQFFKLSQPLRRLAFRIRSSQGERN